MAKVRSVPKNSETKERMLKQIALDASIRAKRYFFVGIVLGIAAVVFAILGFAIAPLSFLCLALSIWAMKDAHVAEVERQTILSRLELTDIGQSGSRQEKPGCVSRG